MRAALTGRPRRARAGLQGSHHTQRHEPTCRGQSTSFARSHRMRGQTISPPSRPAIRSCESTKLQPRCGLRTSSLRSCMKATRSPSNGRICRIGRPHGCCRFSDKATILPASYPDCLAIPRPWPKESMGSATPQSERTRQYRTRRRLSISWRGHSPDHGKR